MSETAASEPAPAPEVREVLVNDLLDVLAAGVRDFRAAPLYGLFFGGIYALGGWLLILLLIYFELPFLVYPLAVGFAIVAPFVATGFYAVSYCLEKGDDLSWGRVFGAVRRAAGRELGWMALVTGFSLFIWVDIAALMFFGFLGIRAISATDLLTEILTTPMGILFLVLGNAVGAAISLIVFSFSVTSFPMLFERDVDFVTAMVTSVKVVVRNRRAMVAWCITIAVLIAACLLTGLLGLFVILPILGHASWHLYRRAIA
ncbi:MAG: DUF2189 domain-containing protein [Alphaproteobacteria bacterium]|jgi:uncharacterized membrane protein|nr:DUF2189 domain-containing protein [Alphaproteobacteria bacterium]